jgi:hypothetical protein
MTDESWRILQGVPTAWCSAPSLSAAAAAAGRVLEVSADALVDLRADGLRVRLAPTGDPAAVSRAVEEAGLVAHPSVLQQVDLVLESGDPSAVRPFWERVLGHVPSEGGLVDPLRREPSLLIGSSSEQRPLRQRVHLDVVRPGPVAEDAAPGEASGPYGVRHADADGTEVDLVPGDPLGGSPDTADWQVVFSTIACYRVTSTPQQHDLAVAAAALADEAGFPLLVDLRPGLVVLDTGKDRGDPSAHGLALDFADLARDLQAVARGLGAEADVTLPRFTQVFLDAVDLEAVRTFWAAALGWLRDPRDGVPDLVDPHRLGPVLGFQDLEPAEPDRLRQRNRLHVRLTLAADVAPARVAAALDAGGRVLEETTDRWVVADPEGNELDVVAAPAVGV